MKEEFEFMESKRDHISLPVHCKDCKKPMVVEWNNYWKVWICENDKCMKNRTLRRVLLVDILFA